MRVGNIPYILILLIKLLERSVATLSLTCMENAPSLTRMPHHNHISTDIQIYRYTDIQRESNNCSIFLFLL